MSVGLHSHSGTSHSNWLHMGDSNWGSMGSIAVSMGLGSVQTTGLAGYRSLDWVADLSGHWVALLHWDLDSDGVGNLGTGGHRLGVALGLWDGPGDGVAGGHWLGHAHSLGDGSGDGGALLSGNLGALGNTDTVGNSDTVWGGHSSGNWDTNWNSNTVRNRHTSGNNNCSGSLDWNLSALSVNLLLTLSGSWSNTNGNWGSCNSWSSSKSSWGSKTTQNWSSTKE